MRKLFPYFRWILVFSIFSILIVPHLVSGVTPIEPTVGTITTIPEIYTRFRSIMTWVYTFAIAIAVIFIILGGIGYMTAGGDETKMAAAKSRLLGGVIGVAIVIGVYTIMTLVAKVLGLTPVTPPAP